MKEATIQKIISLDPIEKSDFLERAQILGWQVVVKKGEFKVGDLCVFVEIDSLLPEDNPEFEFMRPRGFRVKTIKLRGCLSQGIAFPLSIVQDLDFCKIEEGADVSEWLKITHYEKELPAQLRGRCKSTFPSHLVPKTDEVRIQSMPKALDRLRHQLVYSTIKLDGTSFTAIHNNGDEHVCSRNQSFKLNGENEDNLYIQIEKKYDILNKLREIGNYAIQGEIVGPGIQKNRLKLTEPELYVFSIYDIDKQVFVNFGTMLSIANRLGLKTVPLDGIFLLTDEYDLARLLERAKGNYENTKNKREGIVIRPVFWTGTRDSKSELSFKVLNNDYLLTEEE